MFIGHLPLKHRPKTAPSKLFNSRKSKLYKIYGSCSITLLGEEQYLDFGKPQGFKPALAVRGSATTPTGHLTQSDLIQSLDSRNEDYRGSSDSTAGLDTSRRSKGRNHDLDRRPPSQNTMKSIQLSNGRVPPPLVDTAREFEGMRLQNSLDEKSLSHRKTGYFKPNGLRSAFNEKFSQNGTVKEDLVATGTILNSVPSNSSKPLSKSLNSVVGGGHSSAPAFSPSATVGHSTRSTRLSLQRPPLQTNYQRQQKQTSEPKYTDPLNGAEVAFQQRLAELATLEADTVRWERNRKLKKKNRDRDS